MKIIYPPVYPENQWKSIETNFIFLCNEDHVLKITTDEEGWFAICPAMEEEMKGRENEK